MLWFTELLAKDLLHQKAVHADHTSSSYLLLHAEPSQLGRYGSFLGVVIFRDRNVGGEFETVSLCQTYGDTEKIAEVMAGFQIPPDFK